MMNKFVFAAAFGSAALVLAGCSDGGDASEENLAAPAESGAMSEPAPVTDTGSAGTDTADTTIVVEDDVRYRVDPDGTRIRLGPDGADVSVDSGDVDARVDTDGPSLEIETN